MLGAPAIHKSVERRSAGVLTSPLTLLARRARPRTRPTISCKAIPSIDSPNKSLAHSSPSINFNSAMHCIEPFDEQGRSPATQLYEHARQLMEEEKFTEASLLFLQAALRTPHFKT